MRRRQKYAVVALREMNNNEGDKRIIKPQPRKRQKRLLSLQQCEQIAKFYQNNQNNKRVIGIKILQNEIFANLF